MQKHTNIGKKMSIGIVYVMTTAIDGIVKIGKCQKKQYEERMRYLDKRRMIPYHAKNII